MSAYYTGGASEVRAAIYTTFRLEQQVLEDASRQ